MTTLDSLIEQLEQLKAETSLEPEKRKKEMRRVRKEIRKMGGSLRPRGGVDDGVKYGKASRRRTVAGYTFVVSSPEQLKEFAKEFKKAVEAHETLYYDKEAIDFYGFSGSHLFPTFKASGSDMNTLIDTLMQKFYSRWGIFPRYVKIQFQGAVPILGFGPVPIAPLSTTPRFG